MQISAQMLAQKEATVPASSTPPPQATPEEKECDASLAVIRIKLLKLPARKRDELVDKFISLSSEAVRQLDNPQQMMSTYTAQQIQPSFQQHHTIQQPIHTFAQPIQNVQQPAAFQQQQYRPQLVYNQQPVYENLISLNTQQAGSRSGPMSVNPPTPEAEAASNFARQLPVLTTPTTTSVDVSTTTATLTSTTAAPESLVGTTINYSFLDNITQDH